MFRRRTFDEERLLEGFGSYLISELGRSERTAANYRYSLASLSRATGKPLSEITPNDLRSFLRSSPRALAGRQMVLVAMKQFHSWGALEGYWKRNGIMDVRGPKVQDEPRAPMSTTAARRLLEAVRRPLEARLVYLGLYAGMRVGESAAFSEANIVKDRLVFRGKSNKRRTVPIHPELEAHLDLILSYHPKSERVMLSVMERMRERVRVLDEHGEKVTSHTLRRTCGSEMYGAGVPWEVVAKLLGHGLDVTARYVKIDYETMREAIFTLDYWRGEPVQLALW